MIVINNTHKRQQVANQIDGRHGVLDHRPRESDQQPILHHAGDIQGESGGLPDDQEHGQIQPESTERIAPEDHEIRTETRGFPQQWILQNQPRHRQERETARRDVVKRKNRVQLNSFGTQQNLDHDEPGGLECQAEKLQHDAPGVELDLAVSGDGDAEGDGEHVEHDAALEGVFLEEESDGVDGDGGEGLEHLNEGDGEVDVGGVVEPERERVEGADGDDGPEIELTWHGVGVLHDLEDADKEERQRGAEGHVDHGEGDREGPAVELAVHNVLVVHDHRAAQEEPGGQVDEGDDDVFQDAAGESHSEYLDLGRFGTAGGIGLKIWYFS